MIPKASQRANGQDLATHLLNAFDNETVTVLEVRGSAASDLHGAFKEWEFQADALTRCKQPLYSLSINPDPRQDQLTLDQIYDYIGRIESSIGMSRQPRAIVQHVKYGREHYHVVWSRIDLQQEKAIHLAYDRRRLMDVTREFAQDHGYALPDGYYKQDPERRKRPLSFHERSKEELSGISIKDEREAITRAWHHSDSPRAFVAALTERGYVLATGKRPYVLVDKYGDVHALARMIDHRRVNTAAIREFLGKEYPASKLPTVDSVKEKMRQREAKTRLSDARQASNKRLADLRERQRTRRASAEREVADLHAHQVAERISMRARQRAARAALKRAYLSRREADSAKTEHHTSPRISTTFLRWSGFTALSRSIKKALSRLEYGRLQKQLRQARKNHDREFKRLQDEQKFRCAVAERQLKALDMLDRREVRALGISEIRQERLRIRNVTAREQFSSAARDRNKTNEQDSSGRDYPTPQGGGGHYEAVRYVPRSAVTSKEPVVRDKPKRDRPRGGDDRGRS